MKKVYFHFVIISIILFCFLFSNTTFAINTNPSKIYKPLNNSYLKKESLLNPFHNNGIVFPIITNSSIIPNLKVNQTANYTFSYQVSNTKNVPANSYVWVDFDNNGIYTADEAIETTIPANAVNFNVNVNYPNASFINKLVIGTLNIKFTTTTSTLIDNLLTTNIDERSTSLGTDGETEMFSDKTISGIAISGSVFIDGNGITDGIIFGTSLGIIEGIPLNAYLLDNTNTIISKTVFSLGGSYKFENLYKGNYTIAISLNDYLIGTPLASIVSNFPIGWNLAGESHGSIGNLPLGIEPGIPNMQIPIVTQTAPGGTDIFGVNFALNRTPVAFNDEISTPINTPIIDCNLVANDNDPDGNQTIDKTTILLIDPFDNIKKTNVVLPGSGEFAVDATGAVSFVPENNFLGVAPVISYTVKDRGGIESNVGIIKVVVKPVGVNDVRILDAEVPSVTINILANDGISGILAAPAETFSNPIDATIVANPNGDITFVFPPNQIVPNTYVYTYVLKTADGVFSDPITVTIIVAYSPAITLTKNAVFNDVNNDGLAQSGETITYSFSVTNTGNAPVINITVSDPKINLLNAVILPNPLLPGQTGNLIITPNIYTITPADILAGEVLNTATATGLEPVTNITVNSTSNAIVIFPVLTIKLVKTSRIIDVNNNGFTDEGDKIEYIFTVTNTGTIPVINIGITDPKIGLVNVPITPTTLAPGQVGELISASTYTITQADIIKGFVSNIATADGTNAQNTPVTATSENGNPTTTIDPDCPTCTITEIVKKSEISLVKTNVFNDTNSDGFAQAGETITYTFTVQNIGNVTINNISIIDDKLGMINVPINPANLAPTLIGTYSINYILTQANIDAGNLSNTAIANGTDPSNVAVADTSGTSLSNNSPTIIVFPKTLGISLVKASTITDVNNNGLNDVGDIVNYTFTVINTGNVTLTNITLTDNNAALTGGPILSLSPQVVDNTTFTGTYIITQADAERGFIYNIATTKASSPNNVDDVTVTSTNGNTSNPTDIIDPLCPTCTITPIIQISKIALVKKVTNVGTGVNGTFLVGDVINYSFTITNVGNLTLNSIVLTDPLFILSNIPLSANTLLPNASIVATGAYTITAANALAGEVINQATVTALDPKNIVVEDKSGSGTNADDFTITILAKPPNAINDAALFKQNTTVIINVLQNDIGVSSPLVVTSISIITPPLHGNLVINTNGTISYTPNQNYKGADVFTYTVKDVNGLTSNTATVSLTVGATIPEAVDDNAKTELNKEIKIDIIANDIPDGSPLNVNTVIFTSPANGRIIDNKDGTITYTPNPNFAGTDEFNYTVKDENGNITNSAIVKITVEGFFVPNVFTPNGDGVNDTFEIVGLENYSNVALEVYNRWGNQVYKNANYKNQWIADGLNEGTYYYIIKLNSLTDSKILKGWVLIKR